METLLFGVANLHCLQVEQLYTRIAEPEVETELR
jgi:hypothetical protein